MVDTPTTIYVEPGSDLDRALNESNERPVELVQQGARYRVTRIDASDLHDMIVVADEGDIWSGYDPQRVQQKLRASSKVLKGVDRHKLLHDLSEQRGQSSSGRPE